MRQWHPIGGHAVFGTDRADGACVGVRPHIAHHAHRHHRQQHGERLPDLVVEAGLFNLADYDVIALAQQRQALRRNFSEHPHREARTGERLPLQNLFRHAQVAADLADFVLEQVFQRLDQLELHLRRQAAHVVMRLDDLRGPAHRTRLDYVGIQRALHQPFDLALGLLDAEGFLLEHFDEFIADDLALLLRVTDAREFLHEPVGRVHGLQFKVQLVAQYLLHLLEFVLAQHAVVHEDTGQSGLTLGVTHRPVNQHGSDRRIHTARERADRASAAHLLFHLLDSRINEPLWSPSRLRAADLEDEIPQHLRALWRVVHLRVELHRVPLLGGVLDSSHRVVSLGHQLETGRKFERFVTMRHPHSQLLGHALKEY